MQEPSNPFDFVSSQNEPVQLALLEFTHLFVVVLDHLDVICYLLVHISSGLHLLVQRSFQPARTVYSSLCLTLITFS
jgi:hypothetical protein